MSPADADTQSAEAGSDAGLGYVPPRVISFGWIGEAFTLFGARAALWVGASLLALVVPTVFFYGLEVALGDPIGILASFRGQSGGFRSGHWYLLAAISLFDSVLACFFVASLLRMAVRQVRGLPLAARDILRGGRVFLPLLGFLLLYSLASFLILAVCFAPFGIEVMDCYRALFGSGPGPSATSETWLWAWGIGGTLLYLLLSTILTALLLPGFALAADGVGVQAAWRQSLAAMRPRWFMTSVFLSVLGVIYIGFNFIPFGLGLLVALPVCCLASALAYRDMVGLSGRIFPAPPDYGPPVEGVWPPPPDFTTPGP